jgi:Mrp family chromosome partitioning ATPase
VSDRFPSTEELEAQAFSTLSLERLARKRHSAARQEAEPAVMPPGREGEPVVKAPRQEPGQWPDAFLAPSLKLPLHQVAMRHCEVVQTRLWLSNREGSMDKVTTFVGATAGCGTSTVAANFAGALAQAGGRILLISFGDAKETVVSHSTEPSLVPLPNAPNDEDAHPWTSTNPLGSLYTLSGATAPGPMLRSKGFDNFLALSRERFDHVVIDAPALQGHSETLVLCRKADAVVLVIRAGHTRNHSALWTRQQIQKAGGNLAGVVLNRRRYYVPDWIYRLL